MYACRSGRCLVHGDEQPETADGRASSHRAYQSEAGTVFLVLAAIHLP